LIVALLPDEGLDYLLERYLDFLGDLVDQSDEQRPVSVGPQPLLLLI
jgi:hypothetical protein